MIFLSGVINIYVHILTTLYYISMHALTHTLVRTQSNTRHFVARYARVSALISTRVLLISYRSLCVMLQAYFISHCFRYKPPYYHVLQVFVGLVKTINFKRCFEFFIQFRSVHVYSQEKGLSDMQISINFISQILKILYYLS